ncbi:hypothetical protein E2C01_051721 [Portunus trituberculatus]|uniref:Uncharacterized protein n=1 Tax=Portunus trituberculatus TaxID=210409 RepID=A0A5B7GMI3_PORTR|nr:hypothetical protein [Portunus trituberculatus]
MVLEVLVVVVMTEHILEKRMANFERLEESVQPAQTTKQFLQFWRVVLVVVEEVRVIMVVITSILPPRVVLRDTTPDWWVVLESMVVV